MAPSSLPLPATADDENLVAVTLDVLQAARNPDGGYGYYPNRKSRLEPTAWVAMSSSMDAGRALGWLADAQGADGWIRDDRRAPVNYGFNAVALLALLNDSRSAAHAERLADALLEARGLAYGPSPVVRQDNSLQAWSWVSETLSWVEPTAYALLAMKIVQQRGLLSRRASTIRTRIEVAERLLQDRACASGGWNYGNSQVFGHDLYAHGPTTAVALWALQDRREAAFVDAGLRFLASQAAIERSGLALAFSAIGLRLFNRPFAEVTAMMQAQAATSLALANSVTLAALSLALAPEPGALHPLTVEA